MKIALAQLNYHIGNFALNKQKILDKVTMAMGYGADLIVFSELSICGYPPQDLLEYKVFVEQCLQTVDEIARETAGKNIALIVGVPSINSKPLGKTLFNSACFIENGYVKQIIHKTLLPTYDIFDEYRHFQPNDAFEVVRFKGKKIALTICEDIWYDQPVMDDFGRSKLYTVSPLDKLAAQNPDFIINIAASPFSYWQSEVKEIMFSEVAKKYRLPLLYLNQVGAHTELIFDGNSMVFDNQGNLIKRLRSFEEDFLIYDVDEAQEPVPWLPLQSKEAITGNVFNALVLGIRDYFQKINLKTATLGLSGGIDSAVTLVLAVHALGAENVRVLLLPSQYSSVHSIDDSIKLANTLNVQYDIISIQEIFEAFKKSLHPLFKNLPENVTEENIQSRIRGNLLMALSNKFGNILLNTSNKSEAAVGYGTLYGDMSGGLSVIGDVYKTDVYKLARYINREQEIIPVNIITKPPSAELRPDQKDSDSLPEYDVLDVILYHYIEQRKSASEIVKETGFSEKLVLEVLKKVNYNEFKRFQTPPVLRISPKAFGVGRRMPLVAKFPV